MTINQYQSRKDTFTRTITDVSIIWWQEFSEDDYGQKESRSSIGGRTGDLDKVTYVLREVGHSCDAVFFLIT